MVGFTKKAITTLFAPIFPGPEEFDKKYNINAFRILPKNLVPLPEQQSNDLTHSFLFLGRKFSYIY